MPKITTGGRVTIPLRIRAALGVQAGDRIDFLKTANGKFRMVPLTKGVHGKEGSPPRQASNAEKFLHHPQVRSLLVIRQALDKHATVLFF
jgi:antitoxin PrlF